ncbi:MAG: NAD(P)-dependent oxidoreductase [Rhodospirillales bacterium]|nr:MAG: NAD(P)-dependent oxidoreductase [Rhodospirillales bacterium]
MRHVIFGGNGFTGSHLTQALCQRGESVLVADIDDNGAAQRAGAAFRKTDITDPEALAALGLESGDAVYHMAARQYHLPVPQSGQNAYFEAVNTEGTRRILDLMRKCGCKRMVFFSTDMVYGLPERTPVTLDHPQNPIGPYGRSKMLAEKLCRDARGEGIGITIFRPRLIVGPGRLGVLVKLFRLIKAGLPVPMIGNGSNRYQMISVFDCVAAALAAQERGFPNGEFNLGSDNPPTVRQLLSDLIKDAGSRSVLIPTPGSLVKAVLSLFEKAGLPLMYREQYQIADVNYLVDIEATKRGLGWQPQHDDAGMIAAAYREFLAGIQRNP